MSKEERQEIVPHLNGVSIFEGSEFNPINDPSGSGSLAIAPSLSAYSDKVDQPDVPDAEQPEALEKVPQGLRILLQDDDDRMLLVPGDPLSARNRRIEIMVLTQAASDTLYQFYGQYGVKVVKPIADRLQ